jgi:hypothetical protein
MGYALTRPENSSALAVFTQGGRRVLALLMMVTMLVVSLHHLSCFNDTQSDRGPTSISALASPLDATSKAEPCLPGHCHCVCHVSPQRVADAGSRPADFSSQCYAVLKPEHIHPLAGLPPFKPPRV